MPELTAQELAVFRGFFAPLSDSIGLHLSEQLNIAVTCGPPDISEMPAAALISNVEPVLQTTFTYPALSDDETLLIFPGTDAMVFFDLMTGGTGKNPPDALEPEQVIQLKGLLSGFVQGLGISLGNELGLALTPGSVATAVTPISLPAAFLMAGEAVAVEMPFSIEGVMESVLQLYLTATIAKTMIHASGALVDPPEVPLMGSISQAAALFGSATATAPAAASIFQPFEAVGGAPESLPRGMDLIMDIPLDVTVELGRVQMLIKDVLELAAGSIVELERVAGEPVDLLVNGQLIAKGEVVVIEDNFGVRITEIVSPAERLQGVGKRG